MMTWYVEMHPHSLIVFQMQSLQGLGLLAFEQVKYMGEQILKTKDTVNLKHAVGEGAKFLRNLLDIGMLITFLQ